MELRHCSLYYFTCLLAATAAAIALEGMLEVVELSEEAGEESIVRILLQCMVHESESEDKLTGVFVAELLFLSGKFCKCGDVVVAAEVEVEHFLNLTVHYLGEVYVIGTFLFVLITHNCNSFN